LYIGSSKDIKKRHTSHIRALKTNEQPFHKYMNENKLTFDDLHYFIIITEIIDEKELLKLEADCILLCNPLCNVTLPYTSPEHKQELTKIRNRRYYYGNGKAIYKKYRLENKEAIKESKKEHYEQNKETILKQQKDKYENDIDFRQKKKEGCKEYHEKRKAAGVKQKPMNDEQKANNKVYKDKWYKDNKERISEDWKIKYEANKEAICKKKRETPLTEIQRLAKNEANQRYKKRVKEKKAQQKLEPLC
jgi:hypothetical protein